jgi:histone-lysine N-methyltransferase SETMAR
MNIMLIFWIDWIKVHIRKKRPGLAHKKIIFHQDNARPHTCVFAMAKINQLKYDWLPHSPYSPDLAPFDFQLFPKLKMFLGGPRFSSNEEVTSVVDDYFADLKETTFRDDESLRTSLNKVH